MKIHSRDKKKRKKEEGKTVKEEKVMHKQGDRKTGGWCEVEQKWWSSCVCVFWFVCTAE